ncbi:shikimate kinase [Bacillus taeanensis]|uniref:Shikimate kinase n=1 Tax=Bacillus taeanensis TaxID=273032 RepID=A0A366Y3A9_9BACI|nr:shikimate kinase [Bacillus taeanensis]RBW70681.1 shikimate kinase [Bacillus taeanensis]
MNSKRITPIREMNIVLIGFMGVGKTTIGKLIAKKLYREFIDIDHEIEQKYEMSVSDIFKTLGEQEFRKIEKEFVLDIVNNKRLKVVSLGGGAFLQEEIKKACLSNSIVFLIDLSWDNWKERLDLIIDSRPILQKKKFKEIEELFIERKKAYSLHNSRVSTDNLDAEEVADYIVDVLKFSWDINQPHRE